MNKQSAGLSGRPIYTLAQNGTESRQPTLALTGSGSDLDNGKALKGRAKRKLITQTAMMCLVDIASEKNDPKRRKSFWNTYHCQSIVRIGFVRFVAAFVRLISLTDTCRS